MPEKLYLLKAPLKNMYWLLTHEILLYNRLGFFIPPEDSEDINSSKDMEEELTVGNYNRE